VNKLDMSSFSKRLSDLIKESRYSRQEIADTLNVSIRTVENWCTGKTLPDIEQAARVCLITGSDLACLVDPDVGIDWLRLGDKFKEVETLKKEIEQLKTERDEWKEQAKLLREMLTRSQGNQ
jgi:transcriptional regulator with XRE-family HTH domain